VVVGPPKRELPVRAIVTAIVALAALAGMGGGIYYGAANVDWESLPIIGKSDEKSRSSHKVDVKGEEASDDGDEKDAATDATKNSHNTEYKCYYK
jgi:hypothetical protein